MTEEKKLLSDVVIIRPLIIFMVVIYHSFCIYNGQWEKPDFVDDIITYKWLSNFLISFVMPAIIFIAGYVYAYQLISLKKIYSFKKLIRKKFVRLIFPCMFFSVIYLLLFGDIYGASLTTTILSLLGGAGHLWFLPMLFWAFLCISIFVKYKIPSLWVMLLSTIFFIIPIPLPLGIGKFCHYFIFFYMGYLTWINHKWIILNFCKGQIVIIAIIFWVMLFAIKEIGFFQEIIGGQKEIINKIIFKMYDLILSVLGTYCIYIIVNLFINTKRYKPSLWVIIASNVCFGVYVFHQFIIEYLYYKIKISLYVDKLLLPFMVFGITLMLSVLFTKLFLKTKFGRYLIG